jgi:hypothetical protein
LSCCLPVRGRPYYAGRYRHVRINQNERAGGLNEQGVIYG